MLSDKQPIAGERKKSRNVVDDLVNKQNKVNEWLIVSPRKLKRPSETWTLDANRTSGMRRIQEIKLRSLYY